jgi:CubicO group peptidase (beta-lactamase class C family)
MRVAAFGAAEMDALSLFGFPNPLNWSSRRNLLSRNSKAMTRLLCFAVFIALGTSTLAKDPLPRSTPEAQGVSSSKILEFIEAVDSTAPQMNSFMLVRRGQVVVEGWWTPYNAESRHELYSLSKSFTSTAVGMAIEEGKFKLDEKVMSFFPDDAPKEVSQNLAAMRVRDILAMATGHKSEPNVRGSNDPWTKTFLHHPVEFKPGEHFLYNTAATYMQSAIVQKTTGETVFDYLKPRLFEPLGIEDPTWGASPQGVTLGGYGLNVRTEDIAKFGQLYLQKGEWKGKQIVSKDWIALAASKQVSNGNGGKSDWAQGYGFQFWMCRHNAYRGDGAFGQYCIVIPEKEAVIAITSGVSNMQNVLDLVWDKLLPALTEGKLEADAASQEKLIAKLKSLSVTHPISEKPAEEVLAASKRRIRFSENPQRIDSVALTESELTLVIQGVDHKIPFGFGEWKKSLGAIPGPAWRLESPPPQQPLAASAAWTASDTFTTKVCLYETPFISTLSLQFKGDEVGLTISQNVGFGNPKPISLTGTIAIP